MQLDRDSIQKMLADDLTDVLIRVGLIAILVVMCVRIFAPFMGLVLWALVLAVTLDPLQERLAKRMGGRQGASSTVLVLATLLLLGVPTFMLASSFASHVQHVNTALQENTITIAAPSPTVAAWPVIGDKLYKVWELASRDLPALLDQLQPQLGTISKKLLGMVASSAGGMLMMFGAVIIAGVMMAYAKPGSTAMLQIICRLAGPEKGPRLHKLSVATIRSVALGVIGVAFIQALLLGIGFILAGIPAAGVLALLVLLLGIAQLPALLITLPAVGYIWWSGDSTGMNVFFTIYLLVMGMADGLLKPMMLGRGVDAPMPIILIGALGGMVSGGMIGLFLGAVLLTLGYKIFMEWVAKSDTGDDAAVATPAEASPQAEK